MTDEDFLKRWARRKREVANAEQPATAVTDATVDQEGNVKSEAEFDPNILPPLESITAVSDITAFLRAGVPAELTRAALRRVWTADPAIRDFIGLSENAWDFTDPNAMPGFGPLESTDEVRRMIARLIDGMGEATRSSAEEASSERAQVVENSTGSPSEPAAQAESAPAPAAAQSEQVKDRVAENLATQVMLQSNKENTAMQRDVTEAASKADQSAPRVHGGALPR